MSDDDKKSTTDSEDSASNKDKAATDFVADYGSDKKGSDSLESQPSRPEDAMTHVDSDKPL